jgi:fructose-1,6-bisphosphatase/sedoheptulose 1,7-bisphosphatase-like protein
MDKIATGPEAIDAVDIDAPPRENVSRVAKAKGRRPSEISVVVLERGRHEALIDELRETGCKVHLIPDGDVAPAIAAAQPTTGVDLLMGIGGTPEGVIAAEAAESRGPQAIPTYAIRVADDFHRFYHHHRVLESDAEAFRLGLCVATQTVIARCLDLVGVDAPERM